MLTNQDSQLGRGEAIADTAQVLSRFTDIIMIRTFKHETLLELAQHASVPVINGLTDYSHPCQILADIQTIEEELGNIKGKTIAWLGDYNNVLTSWIHAAEKLDFTLHIAVPEELSPPENISQHAKLFHNAEDAVAGVDVLTTDTWVSMGDTDGDFKRELLAPFQVTDNLMNRAEEHAIFLHCLPAHREEEVTASVIDGPRSRVFDEAENRLHAQKAVMLWCLKQLDEVS